MNFSRKTAPNVTRLGAVFGDTCFDITKAIGDDLLEFPRVVFSIEEVLNVKDGLSILEEQLRALKKSSGSVSITESMSTNSKGKSRSIPSCSRCTPMQSSVQMNPLSFLQ